MRLASCVGVLGTAQGQRIGLGRGRFHVWLPDVRSFRSRGTYRNLPDRQLTSTLPALAFLTSPGDGERPCRAS